MTNGQSTESTARCLRGVAWNRGFVDHGEGELRRSVSACIPTRHARQGQGTGAGGCVRKSFRSRANPRTGISGGCVSHAERAAAHHSRENAGWGFATAERSSGALVVCCVGKAKETAPRCMTSLVTEVYWLLVVSEEG